MVERYYKPIILITQPNITNNYSPGFHGFSHVLLFLALLHKTIYTKYFSATLRKIEPHPTMFPKLCFSKQGFEFEFKYYF